MNHQSHQTTHVHRQFIFCKCHQLKHSKQKLTTFPIGDTIYFAIFVFQRPSTQKINHKRILENTLCMRMHELKAVFLFTSFSRQRITVQNLQFVSPRVPVTSPCNKPRKQISSCELLIFAKRSSRRGPTFGLCDPSHEFKLVLIQGKSPWNLFE